MYALKRAKTGSGRQEDAIKAVSSPALSVRSLRVRFSGSLTTAPCTDWMVGGILSKPCHCFTSTGGNKGVLGLPAPEVGSSCLTCFVEVLFLGT